MTTAGTTTAGQTASPTPAEIEVAAGQWLAALSGLDFAQVALIRHYDPTTITDYSLVRSLPADWYERYTGAQAKYIQMLTELLAIATEREAETAN